MQVEKGEHSVGGAGLSVICRICEVLGLLLLGGCAEWGPGFQAW